MRIKINCRPMDPKHMEGRQVILNVEKVDVEKGEILCTLVAISGDIKDDAIPITPISAEWVTPTPKPQFTDEDTGLTIHFIEWDDA